MTEHDVQCDAVREALLDEERSEGVTAHLEGCVECRSLAEALASVDARLAELPTIELPEALIAQTVERVRREPIEPAREAGLATIRLGAILVGILGALAGGLVALVKLALAPFRTAKGRRYGLAGLGVAVPALGALALVMTAGSSTRHALEAVPATPSDALSSDRQTIATREAEERTANERTADELTESDEDGLPDVADLETVPASATVQLDGDRAQTAPVNPFGGEAPPGGTDYWADDDGSGALPAAAPAPVVAAQIGSFDQGLVPSGAPTTVAHAGVFDTTIELPPADDGERGDLGGDALRDGRFAQADTPAQTVERAPAAPPPAEPLPAAVVARDLANAETRNARLDLAENAPEETDETGELDRVEANQAADEAARFLTAHEQVDGVPFVPATGYWASTYVPGDPALRLLRRRLADHPDALALAQRADPGDLALDPPSRGALALHVDADRTAVEGRSRVLVSVGLRGAAVRAGRRPTLRAEVIVDARRPLDDDAQARLRALLMALSRSREGADRVGVIVAGPNGGELLPLGELRFGELTVALRRLFGEVATSEVRPMSLDEAARQAMTSVGQLDDPSSPLASAMVLVVSPALSDADARALEPIVHAGMLAGVTTTALGLSNAAPLDPLERIALAGQGRRRVLSSLDGAEALVRSEVEAVSQVVARAVRLRIRLAPGVQLVDVIGSRRLGGEETRRVRAAEDAVDRRLAQQLGITADRGHDDDGIQIVMPAFYADDAHVVLLDLVAPGPGPVADVSVQLKDLVRLQNATASARITLSRGASERGPRQRQVLARLIGHEVAAALRDAARSLEAGDAEGARARIEAAERLARGARTVARMTLSDARMLGGYARAIRDGGDRGALVASLRYASRRRLEGDPLAME